MQFIEAVRTNDRKLNRTIYSFTVENEKIEVHYIYEVNNQSLEFFHNGESVTKATIDKTIKIDTEKGQVKVHAWINRAGSFGKFMGLDKDGVGIEVDGIPVKATLADPDEYLGQGRVGLGILLFVLTVRGLITFFVNNDLYTALIFFIPALVILAAFLIYKKCLLLSLFIGAIVAVLEFADYVTTIPGTLMAPGGSSMLSMSIIAGWIMFRVRILTGFFVAFKYRNEKRIIAKMYEEGRLGQPDNDKNYAANSTPVLGDTWVCKKCDEINPCTFSSCKSCGEYR